MEVELDGPAGRLQGLLEGPEAPVVAAIVCHPHPLHGGTMDNGIVFRAARALRDCGAATLRFNFRGVGKSAGIHGGSGEEELDASAALDWLAGRVPERPLWAAGYSFGARTVCGLAAREPRIERVILIAPPLGTSEWSCLERLSRPGLLLFGSEDPFGTLRELERRHPRLPGELEQVEIEGADHFFRGRTPVLEERIREYARAALERAAR